LIDENPTWIMDGNFPRSVTYEQRLKEADTVIIFELPKWIIVWRLLKRTIKYYGKQRPDAHANLDVTLKGAFKLLMYILPYSAEVEWEKINKYPHLNIFEIKTLKDEKNFINKIPT
jgi:adenylate kinase family enzyme